MILRNILHIILLVLVLTKSSFALGQEDPVVLENLFEEHVEWQDTAQNKIDSVLKVKHTEKQEHFEQTNIDATPVVLKPFDRSKWKKYNKNRAYIENPKKEKKPSSFEWPNFSMKGFGFIGKLLQILVYLAIVLGFAFLIFRLLQAKYKQDAIVKKEKSFLIEKLEEQIHHIDLYKLLEEYKSKDDLRMLIRIYYLIIIKELSNRKMIVWEIQKTNGSYLLEMFENKHFTLFKNLTYLFERIWFGEQAIDNDMYPEIEALFLQMISKIKTKKDIENK